MVVEYIFESPLTAQNVNDILASMLADANEGCTDILACNYDADANLNDNSCQYAEENYDCNGQCMGSDNDQDGICDDDDDCPNIYNPYQHDRDEDGLADACNDTDDDGDGLEDCWVYWYSDGVAMTEEELLAAIQAGTCQDYALSVDEIQPSSINLLSSYPNPFNPSSTISFNLNFPQNINLSVYDVKGSKAEDLSTNFYSKGSHQIIWNPDPSLSSGLYIIRLETSSSITSHKVLYLK